MLEELTFINGDPSQLQGRCVLYTHNAAGSENPFNPEYPTLAVGADPSDLLDMLTTMLPFPEGLRTTLLERLKESNDVWNRTMFGHHMYRSILELMHQGLENIPVELQEELQRELENIPDEKFGAPLHGCFIPLIGFDPEIIEPYQETCDILQAAPVPNITYAGLVLAGHAQHYLATYFMQREEHLNQQARHQKASSNVPNFKDISKDEFLQILDRKISELMYAYEVGAGYERLLKDLQKLTSGTYLVRDILNLSKLIETHHPNKIQMMEAYLQRVHLLVNERYEEIAAIDAHIRALDQERPIPPQDLPPRE